MTLKKPKIFNVVYEETHVRELQVPAYSKDEAIKFATDILTCTSNEIIDAWEIKNRGKS